jgi:UDP-glucose 4-epimerase
MNFPEKEEKIGTALVLGGNGFIGSHLVDLLLKKGCNVRVLDKYEEKYRQRLENVDYRIGSMGDEQFLNAALDGVDYVFHSISTTIPKTSNEDPVFDLNTNVIDTVKLLNLCVKEKIKKVIYLSSGGTVYGAPVHFPVAEYHDTNPQCSYGIGKITVEKYLYLFNELYGLDYVILRPSNPYGPRQNPYGAQGVVAVFLGKALHDKEIEIWGDGSIIRDYFHVLDLVNGIYMATTNRTTSKVFNLGEGQGNTLNEILQIIKKITKKELNITYKPSRVFDVKSIVLDTSRAKNEFGWNAKINLEEGIADFWEWLNINMPNLKIQKTI